MSEKTFFDFLWKIENFAFCLQKHCEVLESPSFTMSSLSKTQFYIGLYPRGWNDKNAIGIYLFRATDTDYSGPEITSLLFDISLLNYEGHTLKSGTDFKEDFKRNNGEGCGNGSFILREEVIHEKANKFLPQGTLTVLCRVRKFNGEEVKEAGRCIARTHIGVKHHAFNWVIDGILNLTPEEDKYIIVDSTPDSSITKYPSIAMRAFFKPDVFSDAPFQLHIIQVHPDRSNFMVCKISLINEQGDAVLCDKDELFFEKNTVKQIWNFPVFLSKSYLIERKNSLLPSGSITIRCQYTISVGPIMETIEYLNFGPPTLRMINSSIDELCGVNSRDKSICFSLKNDLQNLHKNKKLCDVNLKIDGENFSAHKAILSARSPVFEAMFTSDMKENATGSVSITDLDADTVKQMLSFIYTDSIDDLEAESALKLYFAADKYQLESLKELCSSYLGEHLDHSNVCDVLVLADVHKDHRLKGRVEEFIFFNISEIICLEKWKELMDFNSKLVSETLYHYILKKT